jgi:hypothetical protein
MAGMAARTTRWVDRLRILTKPPGWRPAELGGFEAPPEVDRKSYERFEVPASKGVKTYVFAQFVVLNLFVAWFLHRQGALGAGLRVALSLAIVWSVVSLAALLDGRRWAPILEGVRALALGLAAALFIRP